MFHWVAHGACILKTCCWVLYNMSSLKKKLSFRTHDWVYRLGKVGGWTGQKQKQKTKLAKGLS